MKLKGFDKFREKIPGFSGKKIIFLPLYLLSILIVSLLIQIYFDILPTMLPTNGLLGFVLPWFPVFGVLIMGIIAIFLVYQMWFHRDRLKAKYGQLSYQKVFLAGFGGVVVIFSIVIHNYIAFYMWNIGFWSHFPYSILITTLSSYIPPMVLFFGYLRLICGIFLGFLGLLMSVRALFTFGFDYMTVIYLYFPEESELQDNKIYSALRHPAYAGALIICLGGAILQLTLYSIIFFFILYVGMLIHIHFVEEKELINRFGDSYKEYRKKVPAFFVHPKNWGQFFKFILGKA
ncbi:MAG: methyltransferase family protein [Candidatus Thorarchaeota archaeon]